MLMNSFVMLLGDGFEEIEAIGTLDLLRRANLAVTTCTVNATPIVTGAHAIVLHADICFQDLNHEAYDGVILPGGVDGVKALHDEPGVTTLLRAYATAGKWIAAICAAPAYVLQPTGIIDNRRVTGYPAPEFISMLGTAYVDQVVVIDDFLITAQGPGSTFAFANAIITHVLGASTAKQVATDACIVL